MEVEKMKIYFKEPSPSTSGYEPIKTKYKLMERLGEVAKIDLSYFNDIEQKPKYIPNILDKILDYLGGKVNGKGKEKDSI